MGRYYVTIEKRVADQNNSSEYFSATRVTWQNIKVESSTPKKHIIDMLLDMSGANSIEIYNRETHYRRTFTSTTEFASWGKNISLDNICEIDFSFFLHGTPDDVAVVFSVSPWRTDLELEVKDRVCRVPSQVVYKKKSSNFKSLENAVHSLINPSHKDFSPSNPCVNCDCSFFINGYDITEHFFGPKDLNIKSYKTNDMLGFEYTHYYRLDYTELYYVYATELDNPLRLVYASVFERLNNDQRERGVEGGVTWERVATPNQPLVRYDNLFFEIQKCVSINNVDEFKTLLVGYETNAPIVSFVCVRLTYSGGTYSVEMKKHSIGNNPYNIYEEIQSNLCYDDDLVPPRRKWNYENFDIVW